MAETQAPHLQWDKNVFHLIELSGDYRSQGSANMVENEFSEHNFTEGLEFVILDTRKVTRYGFALVAQLAALQASIKTKKGKLVVVGKDFNGALGADDNTIVVKNRGEAMQHVSKYILHRFEDMRHP